MVTLEMGKVQNKGAAMPLPSKPFFSTNESFHMRYLMIFFHKGHQSNQISKLQVHSYQVPTVSEDEYDTPSNKHY